MVPDAEPTGRGGCGSTWRRVVQCDKEGDVGGSVAMGDEHGLEALFVNAVIGTIFAQNLSRTSSSA